MKKSDYFARNMLIGLLISPINIMILNYSKDHGVSVLLAVGLVTLFSGTMMMIVHEIVD